MVDDPHDKRPARYRGDGLGLPPGADHYRAFVGPPEDYDLIAAMVFNLLTCCGLRQTHRVLDIGCGSLRVARLLIPYLNPSSYFGIEPNRWLVEAGISSELGASILEIKKPHFSYKSDLSDFTEPLRLDFAVAQSIFSHCGTPLIRGWLAQLSRHLKDDAALFATFLIDEEQDYEGDGWVYPACVKYRTSTMRAMAEENGFEIQILDWRHPRQSWAIFYKPGYKLDHIRQGAPSWNHFVDRIASEAGP